MLFSIYYVDNDFYHHGRVIDSESKREACIQYLIGLYDEMKQRNKFQVADGFFSKREMEFIDIVTSSETYEDLCKIVEHSGCLLSATII
jgi:hypothetical protein